MQVIVHVDGMTYKGKAAELGPDNESAADLAEKMFCTFRDREVTTYHLELEDGSFLVLGPEATRNMHLVFKP